MVLFCNVGLWFFLFRLLLVPINRIEIFPEVLHDP